MGALGSDAAIEAADVVLMDDDPAKIALAMRIARRTLRIVYQNIVFALAIKFRLPGPGRTGSGQHVDRHLRREERRLFIMSMNTVPERLAAPARRHGRQRR